MSTLGDSNLGDIGRKRSNANAQPFVGPPLNSLQQKLLAGMRAGGDIPQPPSPPDDFWMSTDVNDIWGDQVAARDPTLDGFDDAPFVITPLPTNPYAPMQAASSSSTAAMAKRDFEEMKEDMKEEMKEEDPINLFDIGWEEVDLGDRKRQLFASPHGDHGAQWTSVRSADEPLFPQERLEQLDKEIDKHLKYLNGQLKSLEEKMPEMPEPNKKFGIEYESVDDVSYKVRNDLVLKDIKLLTSQKGHVEAELGRTERLKAVSASLLKDPDITERLASIENGPPNDDWSIGKDYIDVLEIKLALLTPKEKVPTFSLGQKIEERNAPPTVISSTPRAEVKRDEASLIEEKQDLEEKLNSLNEELKGLSKELGMVESSINKLKLPKRGAWESEVTYNMDHETDIRNSKILAELKPRLEERKAVVETEINLTEWQKEKCIAQLKGSIPAEGPKGPELSLQVSKKDLKKGTIQQRNPRVIDPGLKAKYTSEVMSEATKAKAQLYFDRLKEKLNKLDLIPVGFDNISGRITTQISIPVLVASATLSLALSAVGLGLMAGSVGSGGSSTSKEADQPIYRPVEAYVALLEGQCNYLEFQISQAKTRGELKTLTTALRTLIRKDDAEISGHVDLEGKVKERMIGIESESKGKKEFKPGIRTLLETEALKRHEDESFKEHIEDSIASIDSAIQDVKNAEAERLKVSSDKIKDLSRKAGDIARDLGNDKASETVLAANDPLRQQLKNILTEFKEIHLQDRIDAGLQLEDIPPPPPPIEEAAKPLPPEVAKAQASLEEQKAEIEGQTKVLEKALVGLHKQLSNMKSQEPNSEIRSADSFKNSGEYDLYKVKTLKNLSGKSDEYNDAITAFAFHEERLDLEGQINKIKDLKRHNDELMKNLFVVPVKTSAKARKILGISKEFMQAQKAEILRDNAMIDEQLKNNVPPEYEKVPFSVYVGNNQKVSLLNRLKNVNDELLTKLNNELQKPAENKYESENDKAGELLVLSEKKKQLEEELGIFGMKAMAPPDEDIPPPPPEEGEIPPPPPAEEEEAPAYPYEEDFDTQPPPIARAQAEVSEAKVKSKAEATNKRYDRRLEGINHQLAELIKKHELANKNDPEYLELEARFEKKKEVLEDHKKLIEKLKKLDNDIVTAFDEKDTKIRDKNLKELNKEREVAEGDLRDFDAIRSYKDLFQPNSAKEELTKIEADIEALEIDLDTAKGNYRDRVEEKIRLNVQLFGVNQLLSLIIFHEDVSHNEVDALLNQQMVLKETLAELEANPLEAHYNLIEEGDNLTQQNVKIGKRLDYLNVRLQNIADFKAKPAPKESDPAYKDYLDQKNQLAVKQLNIEAEIGLLKELGLVNSRLGSVRNQVDEMRMFKLTSQRNRVKNQLIVMNMNLNPKVKIKPEKDNLTFQNERIEKRITNLNKRNLDLLTFDHPVPLVEKQEYLEEKKGVDQEKSINATEIKLLRELQGVNAQMQAKQDDIYNMLEFNKIRVDLQMKLLDLKEKRSQIK